MYSKALAKILFYSCLNFIPLMCYLHFFEGKKVIASNIDPNNSDPYQNPFLLARILHTTLSTVRSDYTLQSRAFIRDRYEKD